MINEVNYVPNHARQSILTVCKSAATKHFKKLKKKKKSNNNIYIYILNALFYNLTYFSSCARIIKNKKYVHVCFSWQCNILIVLEINYELID